ncbi:MAG TPA: response regulator [Lamprocystis sp. (in: g-proteobacteria)]|nr:response regulator [Lamprocystis sp. (in: g-proteobacteria)]
MSNAAPRQRILLALDRLAGRIAAGPVLVQAGYCVDEAADGAGAFQAAATHPYDLILLGHGLPEVDGIELARRIRRLPHPRGDVPILALTGDANPPDKDRCYAVGMDGVLGTPLEPLDLLETVAHWVEAVDDPTWGLEARPGVTPPLVNRRTLAHLEDDVGSDLLLDILVTFLDEAERRLRLLEERVAVGDVGGAADQAHALKGSAGTFGAMALRQCVHEMEVAGRAGERERLAVLLPRARPLLAATCDLLRVQYALAAP